MLGAIVDAVHPDLNAAMKLHMLRQYESKVSLWGCEGWPESCMQSQARDFLKVLRSMRLAARIGPLTCICEYPCLSQMILLYDWNLVHQNSKASGQSSVTLLVQETATRLLSCLELLAIVHDQCNKQRVQMA